MTRKYVHRPESKIKYFFNMVGREEVEVMRLRRKKTPEEKRFARNATRRIWSKKPVVKKRINKSINKWYQKNKKTPHQIEQRIKYSVANNKQRKERRNAMTEEEKIEFNRVNYIN